jgi:uncharacterized membrane protein
MLDSHVSNIALHVVTGCGALACGILAMVTLKGGATHRLAGRLFVAFGAIVLITAFIGLAVFGGPAPLAAAFLAAGYQYVSSLRALALNTHGPGWIDLALAGAGLAACGFFAAKMGPGSPSWSPEIGYGAIGFTTAVIIYDVSRYAWADCWRTHVRSFDHGVKMANVYFGMASAALGNSLRDWQPWSQVLPTFLGVGVVVALVLAHLKRRRTQRQNMPPFPG